MTSPEHFPSMSPDIGQCSLTLQPTTLVVHLDSTSRGAVGPPPPAVTLMFCVVP
jgi:hypothetical protein